MGFISICNFKRNTYKLIKELSVLTRSSLTHSLAHSLTHSAHLPPLVVPHHAELRSQVGIQISIHFICCDYCSCSRRATPPDLTAVFVPLHELLRCVTFLHIIARLSWIILPIRAIMQRRRRRRQTTLITGVGLYYSLHVAEPLST